MTINQKYPALDISDRKPQRNAKDEYFPEIDTGRYKAVLPDGRPCFVESWYDKDTELDLQTFYYSTKDIEGWSEEQHYEYLKQAGCMKGFDEKYKGTAASKFTDPSGNEMWSVTVVEGKAESTEDMLLSVLNEIRPS